MDGSPPPTPPWHQVGCAHVRAVGNVEPTRLSGLLEQVQHAVTTLSGLLPSANLTEPRIDVVVACPGVDVPRAAFAPGRAVSFLVVPCDATEIEPEALETVLRHVLERAFDRPPLWLTVGAARYVAARRPAEDGAEAMWPTAADIVHLRKRPWFPLRTVLSATSASSEWTDASRQPRFVAQAAQYVAFASRRPGVDLAAVVSRRDELGPEAAIVQVIGTDLDTFAADAERQFRERPSSSRRAPRSDPSPEGCQAPLSPGDASALRIHALVQLGRLDEARPLAERAVADDPRAASGLAALATVRSAQGSRAEATDVCRRAAESATLSERDSYYCAAVWLGPEAPDEGVDAAAGDDAVTALELLSRTGVDRPADAYYLEGMARLRTGDAGGAASSALEGFARWPDRTFALLVARAYLELKYVASAATILRQLADLPDGGSISATAAAMLARLPSDQRDGARSIPVFRRVGPAERVVTGRLVAIECDDTWARLRVAVGARVHIYAATRLDLLDIRVYGTAEPAAVRCGSRAAPEIVRLTWRREPTAPAEAEGIAASLEFLP
jgi:hypothetical protein